MTDYAYQLYSSRNFPPLGETFRMLADLGYAQVEGYGALFSDLADPGELRALLDEYGLTMPTGHFDLDMVRGQPDRVVEIARALDMRAVFVPATGPDQRVQNAYGWRTFGRDLAEAGKPLQDAGLLFGWHNHGYEFAEIDSENRPLDLILAGDDALAWEVDSAWIVIGGEDPRRWIEKHSGRIVAAHLKDIAPSGQSTDEDGWADLGHGTMDWPGIMSLLRQTPCRYFVMEHDDPSDHHRFARLSLAAAQSL